MPDHSTEADAIADLADEASRHHIIPLDPDLTEAAVAAHRTRNTERWLITNPEGLQANPNRKKGTVSVYDADSVIAAVAQQHGPPPVDQDCGVGLYANEDALEMVVVLNDTSTGEAGWGDHRVSFALRETVEWQRWTSNDGVLHSQARFAELIEDGLDEIVDPPAARMLEIAQTFEANVNGRFKQQSRTGSGARSLVWEETVEQAGGESADGSTLRLPDEMTLALRPFYGATRREDDGTFTPARYAVRALLKFRITPDGLKIGWKLVRPEETMRLAFDALVEQVSTELGVVAVKGLIPHPRTAPPLTTFGD